MWLGKQRQYIIELGLGYFMCKSLETADKTDLYRETDPRGHSL